MIRSRLLNTLLVSIFVASATAAPAAVHFEIPAGDAPQTLSLFLKASRIEMLYRLDKVRGVKTNAVNGDFTPHEALEKMLAGTPLGAQFNQDDSFAMVEPVATATR